MMSPAHTFVICAYQESEYLEDCIQSLLAQTVQSTVKISTPTPSPWLSGVAEKYGLDIIVNENPTGMAGDFNFAFLQGDTDYVTLAHQDDVYEPEYLETVLARMERAKDPIISFTDYYELREGERIEKNRLLQIKRLMNLPLRFPGAAHMRWLRRFILHFGNPICCPSVTVVRRHVTGSLFDKEYNNNMDYKAWYDLSGGRGSFVYCPQRLMGHRIHAESGTSMHIGNDTRSREDLRMFEQLWPKPIARALFHFYRKGQESNEL